jgi:hypothetical protein
MVMELEHRDITEAVIGAAFGSRSKFNKPRMEHR